MKTILIASALIAGFVGCSQATQDSAINGYTSKKVSPEATPDYQDLSQRESIEIGIFFARESNKDLSDGDPAVLSYSAIKNWLGQQSESSFLLGPEVTTSQLRDTEWTTITGKGQRIGNPTEEVTYTFHLYLGFHNDLKKLIGESLGKRSITVVNGHFQRGDFKKMTKGEKSKFWAPLFEAFKKTAKKSPQSYRLAVFNSCESETLENALLDLTHDLGQPNFDVIGHRKKNNYGFFAGQNFNLITNLQKAQPWTTILNGFRPPEEVRKIFGTKVQPVVQGQNVK